MDKEYFIEIDSYLKNREMIKNMAESIFSDAENHLNTTLDQCEVGKRSGSFSQIDESMQIINMKRLHNDCAEPLKKMRNTDEEAELRQAYHEFRRSIRINTCGSIKTPMIKIKKEKTISQ